MKKNILLLTTFLTIITLISFAQKPFIGTLTYSIEFNSEEEIDPQIKSQLPISAIFATDGNKTCSQQITPMFSTITILDKKSGNGLFLIDMSMMGQKLKVKLTKEYLEEQKKTLKEREEKSETPAPIINYIDESKTIAGYKCKKAEITDKEGNVTEVFYTKDILLDDDLKKDIETIATIAKGIEGTPMEWSNALPGQGAITMKYTTKEVLTKKPKASMFLANDDYTEITLEEFMEMMGENIEE